MAQTAIANSASKMIVSMVDPYGNIGSKALSSAFGLGLCFKMVLSVLAEKVRGVVLGNGLQIGCLDSVLDV